VFAACLPAVQLLKYVAEKEYANFRVSVHLSGQVFFIRVMVVQSEVTLDKE
jgi:hypothetical protein